MAFEITKYTVCVKKIICKLLGEFIFRSKYENAVTNNGCVKNNESLKTYFTIKAVNAAKNMCMSFGISDVKLNVDVTFDHVDGVPVPVDVESTTIILLGEEPLLSLESSIKEFKTFIRDTINDILDNEKLSESSKEIYKTLLSSKIEIHLNRSAPEDYLMELISFSNPYLIGETNSLEICDL